MKIPHDQFCVLPWISLEASPMGTVRPCCLAEEEIVDNNGKKFNLSNADFAPIQNSNHMRRLRQDFLDGRHASTCRKCWSEEQAGRTSKRMHTLNRLKHMVDDQEWSIDSKPLLFLDLKLGNICNLKCRICGSWSSSQFATEELQQLKPEEKKQSYHYRMLKQGTWPRENPKFWSEIERVLDQIRYVEFTGGEPFMIQEHFDMLQGMIDRGIADKVEIHYNTNGTHYPAKAKEIWQHFKTVEIAFSIDDLGDRFEYQRTNASWTEVCRNLELCQDLRKALPNVQLQVCSTVNIFNVWHLDRLAAWIDMQHFDFIYWNILHEARYFSIGSLPKHAKKQIADQLDHAQVRPWHRKQFDQIKDFMLAGSSLSAEVINKEIYRLDKRREQDLASVLPELAQMLHYVKKDHDRI